MKLEGKGACRLTDKMFHNHQNTVNIGGKTHPPVVAASTLDCKGLASTVKEGDIVLRSTPGSDSDLIRQLGRCDYSHSGIVTRNAAGELVVTDAYPGRGSGNKEAVSNESVEDFFCSDSHGPPDKGLVARPEDPEAARKAAEWAQEQTSDPAYKFDIMSDFRTSPKDVYCSDFVHQAFQNAGVDLVPSPMDFMSATNKANTLEGMREFLKTGADGRGAKLGAKVVSDSKLERKLKSTFSNFEYITPCQVADNPLVSTVGSFP